MQTKIDKARFIELSWAILGYKFAYYYPDEVHKDWRNELTITDSEYDALEKEYEDLADKLSKPKTATEVGFPPKDGEKRMSHRVVRLKYSNRRWSKK